MLDFDGYASSQENQDFVLYRDNILFGKSFDKVQIYSFQYFFLGVIRSEKGNFKLVMLLRAIKREIACGN